LSETKKILLFTLSVVTLNNGLFGICLRPTL